MGHISKEERRKREALLAKGLKECPTCIVTKEISYFALCTSAKDKLYYSCKECDKKLKEEWHKANPEKKAAYNKKSRGAVMWENLRTGSRRSLDEKRACPSWADKEEIKDFIDACPKGYHTDHIIPLRGSNSRNQFGHFRVEVCGLHILSNLQYLSVEEHMRKGSKFNTL